MIIRAHRHMNLRKEKPTRHQCPVLLIPLMRLRQGRNTLYAHARREKAGTHRVGCKLSVSRKQGWKREKRGGDSPTPATPPTTSPSFALWIALSTADYYRLGKPRRRVFQAKQKLAWAHAHKDWDISDWEGVTFSDECMVEKSRNFRVDWVYRMPAEKWKRTAFTG